MSDHDDQPVTVGRVLRPKALAAILAEPATQLHLAHATSASGVARMVSTGWLAEHHLLCMLADSPAAKKAAAEKEANKPPPEAQGLPSKDVRTFSTYAGRPPEPRPRPVLITENFDDIKETEVDWLWPGRIPLGMPSLLLGRMGDGKSTFVSWLAATVSAGHNWPDSPEDNEPGTVLILQSEESKGSAIKPRLAAFGYGRGKVHAINGVDRGNRSKSWFSLAHDCEALDDLCESRKDVKLVIVDPIGSYIRGIGGNNSTEAREFLQPLFTLAEERDLAVILVAHPNKDADKDVLHRVSGASAFVEMVRMAWYLSEDPSDKSRRLLSLMKGNASGHTKSAIALHYDDRRRRMTWMRDAVNLSARQVDHLLQQQAREAKLSTKRGPDPELTNRATDFILGLVASAPILQSAAADQGLNNGVASSTFRRALKRLLDEDGRVRRFRDKTEGRWWLRLATAEETAESGPREGPEDATKGPPAAPSE